MGILQAVLLANALSARHPENENQETCHNVPTHHCLTDSSVETCEKVPVTKCSPVTSQQCRQVCA